MPRHDSEESYKREETKQEHKSMAEVSPQWALEVLEPPEIKTLKINIGCAR